MSEEQTNQSNEEKTEQQEEPNETVSEKPKNSLSEPEGKIFGTKKLQTGMTIRVHERIKDISPKGEERDRIQLFEGIILDIHGSSVSQTITVRRVNKGYGVEKIFPLCSPTVAKIEVLRIAKIRRARLGFLENFRRPFKRKLKEKILS